MPGDIIRSFQGTAQVFQSSLSSTPILLARRARHRLYRPRRFSTRASSIPSPFSPRSPQPESERLLALMIAGVDLSLVSFIGIILLMGIVKKNAIMMIDFALEAERSDNLTPEEAIYKACVIRFRPDHDDNHGRTVRRCSPCAWSWHRLGTSPASWHQRGRRPHCLSVSDAIHDPRHLLGIRTHGASWKAWGARGQRARFPSLSAWRPTDPRLRSFSLALRRLLLLLLLHERSRRRPPTVLGYYPCWNTGLPPEKINFRLFTHLVHAFATINTMELSARTATSRATSLTERRTCRWRESPPGAGRRGEWSRFQRAGEESGEDAEMRSVN